MIAEVHKILSEDRAISAWARIGDDSFAAFLLGYNANGVEERADALRLSIQAHPWHRIKLGLFVTCSIGYTEADRTRPLAYLIGQAVYAVHFAKEQGGNRVEAGPLYMPDRPLMSLTDILDSLS